MPIYRYQHDSLVDAVHLLTNEKGGLRAYLYADNGVDSEKLRLLKQGLRAEGYKCVPTIYDNKPVLEVRGFHKPDELMHYLGEIRALNGKPEVAEAQGDGRSKKQKLSGSTLKMAGYSYNVGDAAYMWYTAGPVIDKWNLPIQEFNKSERFFGIVGIIGGIGYGLGSLCLTFFGSKDQSINTIHAATSKIERYARKEGYSITPESSIAFVNEEPKRGIWGSIKNTIGRYPSEALNSIYVGVGLCLSAAAFYNGTRPKEMLKEFKKLERLEKTVANNGLIQKTEKELENALKWQKWDRIDVGLGAVTAISAILGLAVKEQKRLDGEPKRHGIGGVVDWIREKPLRATGIGYMIATGFHTVATHGKWKDGEPPKYLIGRVIFIATNIVSEVMLMLSSKGHGIGIKPDSSIDDSIIATAAELVLRQPAEKREAVIQQLSGYIASPEVLAIKADQVQQSLRQHLNELGRNPWTRHYVRTANGDMVEAAPLPVVAAPVQDRVLKPSTMVSNVAVVAKQQAAEHALA